MRGSESGFRKGKISGSVRGSESGFRKGNILSRAMFRASDWLDIPESKQQKSSQPEALISAFI